MTRTAVLPKFVLIPLLLAAACDRSPPEPRVESNAAARFDNTAAAQSIMQPAVVAENPPEPSPAPTATPAAPRSTTIAFAAGTALDAAARAALDVLAATLSPDARLVLRGHGDSSGSDAANLAQSRRRAEAVRAYLASRGIDASRMEVIALGERRPVAPNAHRDGSDDPVGRAQNRRVEVEVLPPAPASHLIAPAASASAAAAG